MADREILISTAIDTSGFETDAQKLQQAAQRTADSIGKTFEDLKSKLSRKDVLDINYWEDRNGKGHTQFNDRDVLGAYDFIEANGGVVDSWADIVDAMRDYKEAAAIATNERKKQIKTAKEEEKVEKKVVQKKQKEVKEEKKATKENGNFGQSLKKGIGTLLKFGVVLQVLRKVFSVIKSAAKEGINNLVQVDKSLNKSLSAVKSSLTQLKNALGSVISPLIQLVEPFLTKLINWLTDITNKVAELMAALAGQKTFKKAKAVQEDYAASVAKTVANLSGLDEIKTFDDNNGNAYVEDMYDTAKVELTWESVIEKIKQKWEDFKLWFSEFDFWGAAFGASSALSSGLESLMGGATKLILDIDFEALGRSLYDTFSGWIHGADFAGIAESISALLGAAIGQTASFLDGLMSGLFDDISSLWESAQEKWNKDLEDCGGNVLSAIIKGAEWNIGEAKNFIQTKIIDPFVNAFMQTSAGQKLSKAMEKFKKWIDTVTSPFKGVKDFFSGLADFFGDAWKTIKDIIYDLEVLFRGSFAVIIAIFKWLGEKLSPIIEPIVDAINTIWDKVSEWYGDLKEDVGGFLKSLLNEVIKGINKVIKAPFDLLNGIVDKLKNFSILGTKPFSSLKTVTVPQIPLLASGAVIPPNAPFMAMLGDQKRGTNIEAPLDTIKEAVAEVVGVGGTYQFTAQINRKTLFDEIIEEGRIRRTATGRNPFQMA